MGLRTQMLGVFDSTTFDKYYGDRVLVSRYGALGNGTTDDLSIIQEIADDVEDGTMIVLPPTGRASGGDTEYLIDGPLTVRGSVHLWMPGGSQPGLGGVTIKVADGADPVAAIIQAEWLTASTSCADKCAWHVRVNGNKANNSTGYGIIGTGYNSEYAGYATNCAQSGLRLPDRNSSNTNLVGTMSDVRINNFGVFECGEEGVDDGILIEDHGTGCIVDGWMTNVKSQYSGRHGINHQRLAGWTVWNVHSAASGGDGFKGSNPFGTEISTVYIDGFGAFDDEITAVGFNIESILAGRPLIVDKVRICGGEASNPSNDYIYARFVNQSGGVSSTVYASRIKVRQDTAGGASSTALSLQPNNAAGVIEFIEDNNQWAGLATTIGTGTVHRYDTDGRKLGTTSGTNVFGFMETLPLSSVNQSGASAVVGTGTLSIAYFQANQTATISNLTTATGSTAQASATLCRMALFEINPQTGDGTCIATTTNDTGLWVATNTGYTKAITGDGQGGSVSSVMLRQGRLYGLALLHVGGGSPTFAGKTIPPNLAAGAGPTTRAFGYWTGRSDIPASFTAADVDDGASGSHIWGRCT